MIKYLPLFLLVSFSAIHAQSQITQPEQISTDSLIEQRAIFSPDKKWFDKINIRGYVQLRYNRLLETNSKLKCDQCDKSWGENGGFFLRRIRIIFFGQISERMYFYIQPDFASFASSTALHFTQMRDAYFDLGLDSKNEFRLRIGQSKVPYGFENMQSSQNRLPLDRNDALNSAVANERDIGVFFYWAPTPKRRLFSELVRSGLKGSGDYGVLAFGAFNGQTANRPELNNEPHIVARASNPFMVGKQIMELGIQGYTGEYVLPTDQSKEAGIKKGRNYIDQRAAGSFILYPQPFGIQAEYNIGRGPEYNPFTDSIEVQNLHGGYILLNYQLKIKNQLLIPFSRFHYYNGGKKFEQDARSYEVKELETGFEWQPFKNFELVAMYTISARRFEDNTLKNNYQKGNLLRLQAQLNF